MKKTIFTGAGVAIVTPMNPDGSINYDKYNSLVDFQIENQTDAIIVCGTTGESPVLNHDEHTQIIRHTVKRVAGRVPVVAGTGSNDTAYALELCQEAQKDGADAALLVTPYYNKSSQSGLIRHYTYLADHMDLPIIVYNVPGRTGCNIKPETYLELSKHPNIVATKEANGDVLSVLRTKALCGDNLDIYSGSDELTAPILAMGGKGIISVLSNILPKLMHDLATACLNGETAKGVQMQTDYLDLMLALFADVNPIPIKEAMNLMGMDVGDCRMPLAKMEAGPLEVLKKAMQNHQLI